MSSRFLRAAVALAALLLSGQLSRCRELRVCADPNNLPFSNSKEEGFENRIASLLATDLQANLHYQWQRMGRGFVREFVNSRQCDVVMGVPHDFAQMLTTSPYYRSTYVFVVRSDAQIKPTSLDDPDLRKIKIGVQALDEQYAPPGQALVRRGLQGSLVPLYGVGESGNQIVVAVADRKVDAAVVWGPAAGYECQQYRGALQVIPLKPEADPPGLPFTFEISMGVQKGKDSLRDEMEAFLRRRSAQIHDILTEYAVPQLEMMFTAKEAD